MKVSNMCILSYGSDQLVTYFDLTDFGRRRPNVVHECSRWLMYFVSDNGELDYMVISYSVLSF